ncbi:unnamed protein product [Spirodela intermedia]|uniref:Uncharacterized protein n=1 Tax=Spirodela intermedia TaxID=51605 RepID=A0A7I8JR53_SPIIN|nr:unnamed protein product [Spirodela intermedia]CAA6672648.1 unnamed protein product [Spirodela intermedia]
MIEKSHLVHEVERSCCMHLVPLTKILLVPLVAVLFLSRSFCPMHSAGMPSHSKRCLPRVTLEDGHSAAIV